APTRLRNRPQPLLRSFGCRRNSKPRVPNNAQIGCRLLLHLCEPSRQTRRICMVPKGDPNRFTTLTYGQIDELFRPFPRLSSEKLQCNRQTVCQHCVGLCWLSTDRRFAPQSFVFV